MLALKSILIFSINVKQESHDGMQGLCTCYGEPVHVVEQVDVAEDEDRQQRSDCGHAAGRLLLLPLARLLRTLCLAVIGEQRRRVWCELAHGHGCH